MFSVRKSAQKLQFGGGGVNHTCQFEGKSELAIGGAGGRVVNCTHLIYPQITMYYLPPPKLPSLIYPQIAIYDSPQKSASLIYPQIAVYKRPFYREVNNLVMLHF